MVKSSKVTGVEMNSEFLQFSGQVAVRSLSIISTLIVARLAPSTALGDFLQLQMMGLVVLTIMFGRFERAVIDEKRLLGAVRASQLCATIGLATIVPLALVCAFMVTPARPTIHPYVFLTVCGVLALKGIQLLSYQWFQRLGGLTTMGWVLLAQIIAQAAAQLLLLQTTMRPLTALLFGEFIGLAVFAALALYNSRRLLRLSLGRFRLAVMHMVALRHQDLPKRNLPGALLSQSFLALPLIAFAMKAQPAVIGHFGLALRLSDALFLVLAGATTSLWIAHRLWSMDTRKLRLWLVAYLALVIAGAVAYLALGAAARHWASVPNWVGAANWVLPAVLWSGAIGLSGPLVDIVGFQRGDRPALLVHCGVLVLGLLVAVLLAEPIYFLWSMVMLAWLRAAIFIGLFRYLRQHNGSSMSAGQ